jgi:secondary thiamine-phosphate synthase enzyme
MKFSISTTKKQELIDITGQVNEIIKKSKLRDGLCNVYVKHTTAAVIINENDDPNICSDLLNAMNKTFPDKAGYLHDRMDGNAGAHIKAAVLGPSETLSFEDGKLKLGRWQALMLVELDGPRKDREIEVMLIPKTG